MADMDMIIELGAEPDDGIATDALIYSAACAYFYLVFYNNLKV